MPNNHPRPMSHTTATPDRGDGLAQRCADAITDASRHELPYTERARLRMAALRALGELQSHHTDQRADDLARRGERAPRPAVYLIVSIASLLSALLGLAAGVAL